MGKIKLETKTNILILSVFIFIFFTQLFYWIPRDIFGDTLNLWVYTDWLIDYSAGFVRRGLSGELLNVITIFIHPRVAAGCISWLIFCIVVFGYIRLCKKSIKILTPLSLIAILFLPSLLPFYLYDHDAFGRKEIIGFLIILWHLYFLEKNSNSIKKYVKKLLFITVILLPMHIFIHEASFLLFVPIHTIITYTILTSDSSINRKQKIFKLMLIYLPVIFAFSIVFIFGRPNSDVAYAIYKKWEFSNAFDGVRLGNSLPGALVGLPWSFVQAAGLTFSLPVKDILNWLFIFILLGFSTVYFTNFSNTEFAKYCSKIMTCKYFLIPLLISFPVYILGWDFGRWFAISCINFIMIRLSKDINVIEANINNKGKKEICISKNTQNFEYVKLFLLLLIIFFIRMPHCCVNRSHMFAESIKILVMGVANFF